MSAIKPFTILTSRELVNEIFAGNAEIKHRFSDRYSQDITDALRELLEEYDDMKSELSIHYEMRRHNDKLEAMLDRRKARYKKWEDVEYDLYR